MTYDVFLSHASADKPAVEALARRLREDGLEPFLDKWHLIPGEPWQEALEDALEASRTCAVFLGKQLGPWQNEEMRAALEERVRNGSFRVIPVLLPGAREPDKQDLPSFLRRLNWVDFCNGLDDEDAYHRLACGIRGVPPEAGPVPPPIAASYRSMARATDQFVHRRELDAVRELLVGAAGETVGITTALRGAGGFGKTALAQALCEDPRVREAYPHGILWAQMRDDLRDADRLDVVQDLVRFLRPEERPSFETLPAASARLREVLDGRRVLVVVDDAWHAADVELFHGLRGGTTVLVTTRVGSTLPPVCRRVVVDTMRPSEAVRLLVSGLEIDGDIKLERMAHRLGKWPLLLRLVNGQLRELTADGLALGDALREIEAELDESGLTAFDVDDQTAREKAVGRTLGVSLGRLSVEERNRFHELAVFPEDVDVPLSVLEQLWELPSGTVRTLCRKFHDLSLLVRFDRTTKTIRLHNVVRQYLIGRQRDLPSLHRRLLERCRPESGRWTDLEEGEIYLWRHLATHLAGAGDRAELRCLIFDLGYCVGKLRTVGVNSLLADFDILAESGEARTVQDAMRLSAHVLSRDWGRLLGQVLAGQLLGRLGQYGDVEGRLLQGAARRALLRPRRVRLSRTGGPLIRTLEGHTSGVRAIAVLDERRVVSASDDHTMRVWDLESGETIRTLEGHTDWVLSVTVLDKKLISASHDTTLRIWDVESGEIIQTLKGHTSGVLSAAVLNEKHLVSASEDHTLRIWDVDSGKTMRTLRGHSSGVFAVAVLDEKRVVSASDDHTLRIWDVDSGETIRKLEGHNSGIYALAVIDRKRLVSASTDMTLRLWDVESGETIRKLEGHTAGVLAIAVLDGERVISASSDQTIRVWDLESGKIVRTLEGHTEWVNAVRVLDDKRVISASDDQTLRVWDVDSGEAIRTLQGHTSGVNAVAVLDDSRVVSASDDQTLRVWDLHSGETVDMLQGHTSGVDAVAVLDERRVASGSDETLYVWDIASGVTIATLQGHTDRVSALAVLDEMRLVSASSDHTLRMWDLRSAKSIRTLQGHTDWVSALAVLDKMRVISASRDQTLRIWNLESGETVRTLQGHTNQVGGVVVVEKQVISASDDETLRVWDLESGETIRTLHGHTSSVRAVAVVDEKHVLSASSDTTLRVWDLESGETVAVFVLDAPVLCIAVAANRGVVAGDAVGGVHFLDLDLDRLRSLTGESPRRRPGGAES